MSEIYDPLEGLAVISYDQMKQKVQEKALEFFGSSFNLSEDSPNGMLLRFMADSSWLFYQGLQALNSANRIAKATGNELDKLGEIYSTPRIEGEGDTAYRYRLLNKKTKTVAVYSAIKGALEALEFIDSVALYDVSNNKTGVTLGKGNIYICLEVSNNLDDEQKTKIAQTILDTRAAGILPNWFLESEVDVSFRDAWQVADDSSVAREAKWTRITTEYLFVQVTLSPADPYYKPSISSSKDTITEEINQYLATGKDITLDKINDIIGTKIDGVKGKNILMALNSKKESPAESEYMAEDITLAPNVKPLLQELTIEWS